MQKLQNHHRNDRFQGSGGSVVGEGRIIHQMTFAFQVDPTASKHISKLHPGNQDPHYPGMYL